MYGSSYFDLKAELSRKEEQVKVKSNTPQNDNKKINKTFEKIQQLTGKKKKVKKTSSKTNIDLKEKVKEETPETLLLYEKAKMKLEAKEKIYNKMQNGEMEDFENIYGETKFLVDFQHKTSETYNTDAGKSTSSKINEASQSSSIYDADDTYREQLHAKWEQEQQELLNGPLHYENVKFDEIRDLGTGYFAFSKNEEERRKQLEELHKMRDETLNIHAKKENLKNKRKMALRERLNKVKQRKLGVEPSPMDLLNNTAAPTNDSESSSLDNVKPVVTTDNSSSASNDFIENKLNNDQQGTFVSDDVSTTISAFRKNTATERLWDKGKSNQFTQQAFVPAQKPKRNTLETMMTERRGERQDEFAPPNFY